MKLNVNVSISNNLQQEFPDLKIAIMKVKNIDYQSDETKLKQEKQKIEKFIGTNYQDVKNLDVIKSYNQFFKKFGKVYPIQYQIQSIIDGKGLPSTIKVVEAMFMAELQTMFLTAGHDLDKIEGNLKVELTDGDEKYLKINQKDQILKPKDLICSDNRGIISSVLYGPDFRTRITKNTENCLFFSYFPYGQDDANINGHFNSILKYIKIISTTNLLTSEIEIFES
ncbi:MAG: Phenylalanine--tRNA ligase beta subunit [Candidatus Heimdallarchaeota archaeon LC_2]|nr:MAG: Phenylalanine--tRNA ligase beta subunit [Candidatus Heimdallarchaeota archaeon LC_2]